MNSHERIVAAGNGLNGALLPRCLCLALPFALAACAGGHVPPPEAAVPPVAAFYRHGGAGPAVPVPWLWAAEFRSAELTRLVGMALRDNLDIAAAKARIAQADAQLMNASAGLYPRISGTAASSGTQSGGARQRAEGPFLFSKTQSFSLGLSASYSLDLWGLNRANALAGLEAADAARFDRDVAALATQVAMANSYVALLAAQDRLKLIRGNGTIAGRVLEAMRARVQAGTGTALDIAQQDSVVAQQQAQQPAVLQSAQQAQVAIAVLAGQTPEAMQVQGGSLMTLALPSVRPGLPSQLLLRRADLAAAEARLLAAGANVDAARAAFFPDISLTAQGGTESLLLRNLLRPEALAASLAASVAQKVFTGFQLEAQLELTKSRHAELMASYRKAILQAFADVENALIAVRQSAAQEAAQRRVVEAARRAHTIMQQRLREGTIDIVTLLNVQQTLFNAEDALIQARARRFQAAIALYQALGGGWTSPKGGQ